MSLVSALYTGVSGIQAFSQNMQVIGNNIANVNTAGFKSSNAIFSDLVSSTLSTSSQIGRGTRVTGTQTSFLQGSFQATNKTTDMAIDGNGFFILDDGTEQTYTRTGIFALDQDGFLVNNENIPVQGFTYDAQGNLIQNLDDINLNNLVSPPNPTGDGTGGSGVEIFANIDSAAPVVPAFDVTDTQSTSNFSTSVKVFDSQGEGHVVTVYFSKTSDNNWSWNATIDEADFQGGGSTGNPVIQASGTLVFNESGALVNQTTTTNDFDFAGAVIQDQVIGFNFGDDITNGGTGLSGTTQFASPSIINFTDQDGFSAGNLRGISVDQSGNITGIFSNGQAREVAQVAVATFQNENGLLKVAGNRWAASPDSGNPTITTGGGGAAGTVLQSTLELSNVDLSQEFVSLITNQRALQASSRIVTASDELLTEVVNLVR